MEAVWTKHKRWWRTWMLALRLAFALLHRDAHAFFEPRNSFGTKSCPRSPQSFVALPPIAKPNPRFSFATIGHSCLSIQQAATPLQDFATMDSPLSVNSLVESLWKHLQEIFLQLSQPIPGQQQTSLAAIAANLASIPFWTKLTASVQRLGEVSFLTLLFVALLQGGLAVFQYRYNPQGELMVPPGPTVGEELPQNEAQIQQLKDLPSTIRSGGQINSTETTFIGRQSAQQQQQDINSNLQQQSRFAGILQRINRSLVVLVPWLAGRANFILQRNAHLLHIGSILTLTSIFDIPQSLFQTYQTRMLSRDQFNSSSTTATLSLGSGDHEHVVVIGDSLAVGLGSVDQYDKNKTKDAPFRRIENVREHSKLFGQQMCNHENDAGPAFPRSLARALAQKLRKRVTWRSAGVDGGDISQVREYCLGVIEEEVKRGRPPDVVVILCGANDIKYCLSNPFQRSNWPRKFRSKLTKLIKEIQSLAPQVTIIIPAIPAQMFHKNSPLNVFPLGVLLDTMVGFWDSQKKFVADSFNSEGVQYLGLSPREVSQWYHPPWATQGSSHEGSFSLIARDGVHPNARCYTRWAEAVGRKLLLVGIKKNNDQAIEA